MKTTISMAVANFGLAPDTRQLHAIRLIQRAVDLAAALLNQRDERALSLIVSTRAQLEFLGGKLVSLPPPGTAGNVINVAEKQHLSPGGQHQSGEVEREAFGDLMEYCIAVETAGNALRIHESRREMEASPIG
jgi:hypothetical protein